MIVDQGVLYRRYEQHPREGMGLGRHQELDARSLAFAVTAAEARRVIRPAEWPSPIPTLDQLAIGRCTGNAGTYHLARLYQQAYGAEWLRYLVLDNRFTHHFASLSLTDAIQCEDFADTLYSLATHADPFAGYYPPTDTGSSGLGVCRVAKSAGLIGGYRHALSARSWATLLQDGGTMGGMPWFNAFFEPDNDGFIDADPRWMDSGLAGAHELYFDALEAWSEVDLTGAIVRFHQSWGPSWGDHGHGRMRLTTYQQLRAQFDVKQMQLALPV